MDVQSVSISILFNETFFQHSEVLRSAQRDFTYEIEYDVALERQRVSPPVQEHSCVGNFISSRSVASGSDLTNPSSLTPRHF